MLLEDFTKSALVVGGEVNDLDVDVALASRLDMLLHVVAGRVELVAKRGEVVDNLGQPGLVDLAAKEETLAGLGHAEVHGRLQRCPVGFNKIFTEAGDLTSRGHLDTKEGVGAGKTGPRELRHLGGDVVTLDLHEISRVGNLLANKGLGGNIDEVGAENLADERERTRRTQIALDDLELGLAALGVLGLDDLHVEGTGDVPRLGDSLGNVLAALLDRLLEVDGGENKRSVTRVNTSLLDVLRHSVHNQLALGGDTIDVNLLRALDKLGNNNRVVRRHIGGRLELVLEILLAANHRHGSARQDITRTHQHRVPDLVSKLLGRLDRRQLLPRRLVNADAVENLRELLAILSLVNVQRVRAQHFGPTLLLQSQRNVLRQLPANRHHHARCALQFVNIHHPLVAQLLKIQFIRRIIISRHRLRVIIDHYSLFSHVAEGLDGRDGAPVELDGGADSVDAAAEDNGAVVFEGDVVGGAVVCGVEVVCVGREFGSEGVDALDPGADVEGEADGADLVFGGGDGVCDLAIGEAELLSLEDLVLLEGVEAACVFELAGAVDDVLELVEEPLVDLGEVVDLVDGVVFVEHGLADGEPAAVGGVLELEVEVVKLVALEADEAGVDLADGLLEGLFKGTADSHDLADGLHGAANVALDVLELGKIPSGHLGDDVVEGGLKVGGGCLCDGVGQLGEAVAEANLGGGVGEGVAGGLGGEGGGAGETGVDLDDAVVEAVGLEGVLDVALADDAEMADDFDGGGSEHVVLLVAEGLAGGDDNGVTGVDAEGVKVLHVADGDAVVVCVTDNLVLELLPALEGLFDEDLGREGEGSRGHVSELFLVVGKAGAETTQGVGCTDNDGVADLFGGVEGLVNGADGNGLGNGDVDFLEGLGEQVSVFGKLESSHAGAENLDAVLFPEAETLHLDTEVEGSLSTKGEEDAVGLFSLNYVRDIFGGDGEVVDLVRKGVVCLDGGNVGVDEHRRNAGLLEGLESLGACAVAVSR